MKQFEHPDTAIDSRVVAEGQLGDRADLEHASKPAAQVSGRALQGLEGGGFFLAGAQSRDKHLGDREVAGDVHRCDGHQGEAGVAHFLLQDLGEIAPDHLAHAGLSDGGHGALNLPCPIGFADGRTAVVAFNPMAYTVKEIFLTLQGEGAQAGRAAVFCRFAGCNLWSGREEDRASATCRFCDTDFVGTDGPGGGKFATASELAAAVASHWPGGGEPYVVCTGGEPLLQLDTPLVDAFHASGFSVAVETNGTRLPPPGLDWICVSPKAGADLVLRAGDEIKLVYPQLGAEPHRFEDCEFRHWFLQPMDGPRKDANTAAAVRYCLAHPRWRLSLQTHKLLGIP